MNQILVSEKVYVTPIMKKKKKFFKIEFILSICFLFVLFSYCVYAEYDRTKKEQESQEILASLDIPNVAENNDNTITEEVIIVILNSALEEAEVTTEIQEVETQEEEIASVELGKTSSGITYYTVGVVKIPSIDVEYPILAPEDIDDIDALLKISTCKFWGADPNEVGNLCIVGHNYRNSQFFSKVPKLSNGDIIEIKDLTGRVIEYEVYDKYIVDPSDVACTSQLTDGKKEVTLITCTDDSSQRVIVKAKEVK